MKAREPWFDSRPLRRCLNIHGGMLCDGPKDHGGGCTFTSAWELVRRLEDEVIALAQYAGPRMNVSARDRLAGFWNAWFNPREIAAARALAATSSEEECQAELDRLERERDHRLAAWRWSQ